ncbi:probable serine/threonine protein kinase IREH1 isoform X2 [Hevea brasiliensis]|uniref:probable serine/threonine protein kinase IREH1 isoform X2 n=1 Tax=Hevea brasiliensis TaxID=3981 RepID=UPI0025F06FEF|nr:probable serine/threonine protein kinase IREH1 isoform X2 [Hevea brasiliensis]
MVFKNKLFFSSKKSGASSPDGTDSPRSVGSNSPIGSDKKKPKSSSKDESPTAHNSGFAAAACRQTQVKDGVKKDSLKGKESASQSPGRLGLSNSGSKKAAAARAVDGKDTAAAAASSVSPILASSLGLNRIKTRSGPLPQESFFSFRGDKGSGVLGSSNLSKPCDGVVGGGGGSSSSCSGAGKKKEIMGESRMMEFQRSGVGDNDHNWDSMISPGTVHPGEVSPNLQARSQMRNGESSTEAGQHKSSWGHSGGLRSSDVFTAETYDCENPKESESPRFQAILRVTSAPRKRFPADVKSFSHELNSKGFRPFPFWKPRGRNNLEEILVVIRAKFDKAKEEVNSDLALFAADLVGILEKNAESHPEWQETIEDLLVLARSCAMTSPSEFWLQCEGIVQELDDRRQELPPGMLKQLHTRILFILTRCTRLLQFHKESGLAEDENVFQLRQSRLLHSADKHIPLGIGREGKSSSADKSSIAASAKKSYSQEQHGLDWNRDQVLLQGSSLSTADGSSKNMDSPGGWDRMSSWKKLPSPAAKNMKEVASSKELSDSRVEPLKMLKNRKAVSDADLIATKLSELPTAKDSHEHSTKHQHKVSWGYWGDQQNVSDESSIICRICEEEVPTSHVEDHSRICAIADCCDQKGLRVNERLVRISEALEKMIESFAQKDIQHGVGSPDVAKVSNSSVTEESDVLSPKLSDWSRRGSEDMLDCFPESDNCIFMDDLKGLPSMSCKTRFGPKSDQGVATSSAGSMTPRSPLLTPRSSHIDLLLAGKVAFSENDDIAQMNELADIARCVANTPLDDDNSMPYLLTCLEDLRVVIDRRKFDALTVETFGTRIEKLIREKYLQLCELVEDERVDITSTVIDEDAPLEDDVVQSLRTSPIYSKDRTSIDDFEIIKPISRGAFGRVFLAKKRTTGDLFAIKLTDFGLSKVGLINSTDDLSGPAVSGTSMLGDDEPQLSTSEDQQERRKKRSAVGTPDYLAPEILLGTGHGTTADWWSVGVILFELLVGIPPFNAEHPQIIFDNILNRKIPWPRVPEEMSPEALDLIDRLLTEDPHQRLGAGGASEVKQHVFFKNINWDTLARQKAAFVPSSESALDTSYFTSRYSWNTSDDHVYPASEFEYSSDADSLSGSSSCLSNRQDEVGDEFGGLAEFESGSSFNYSFSNFSFKNLSQLASINYDLLSKGWKDDPSTNPNS